MYQAFTPPGHRVHHLGIAYSMLHFTCLRLCKSFSVTTNNLHPLQIAHQCILQEMEIHCELFEQYIVLTGNQMALFFFTSTNCKRDSSMTIQRLLHANHCFMYSLHFHYQQRYTIMLLVAIFNVQLFHQ